MVADARVAVPDLEVDVRLRVRGRCLDRRALALGLGQPVDELVERLAELLAAGVAERAAAAGEAQEPRQLALDLQAAGEPGEDAVACAREAERVAARERGEAGAGEPQRPLRDHAGLVVEPARDAVRVAADRRDAARGDRGDDADVVDVRRRRGERAGRAP